MLAHARAHSGCWRNYCHAEAQALGLKQGNYSGHILGGLQGRERRADDLSDQRCDRAHAPAHRHATPSCAASFVARYRFTLSGHWHQLALRRRCCKRAAVATPVVRIDTLDEVAGVLVPISQEAQLAFAERMLGAADPGSVLALD